MELNSEIKKRLIALRMRRLGLSTSRTILRSSPKQYPKIMLRKKAESETYQTGYDAPINPDMREILRKTCRLVPADSELEQELRESQQIQLETFQEYTSRNFEVLYQKGVELSFFSMECCVKYPYIHCIGKNSQGPKASFRIAFDSFLENNQDMFYKPNTFRAIESYTEIYEILAHFAKEDKKRLTETFENLNRGLLDRIFIIGRDMRTKNPEVLQV